MNNRGHLREQVGRWARLWQEKEQSELAHQQGQRPELEERRREELCHGQQLLPAIADAEPSRVVRDEAARRLGQDEEPEVRS